MIPCCERPLAASRTSRLVERLSVDGCAHFAKETAAAANVLGLWLLTTPVCAPVSNDASSNSREKPI